MKTVERKIFNLADALVSTEYNPYAMYKLRRVRFNLLKSRSIACKMVYGVPKSWR